MQTKLKRSGHFLLMTLPKIYVEQNCLQDGSLMDLEIAGNRLVLSPFGAPKYNLEALMAEMPEGLPRVEFGDNLFE